MVSESVAFVDMQISIPDSKKKCNSEFKQSTKSAFHLMATMKVIDFVNYAFDVKYHLLCHEGNKLSVLVASAVSSHKMFGDICPTETRLVNNLGYIAHGQCWAM